MADGNPTPTISPSSGPAPKPSSSKAERPLTSPDLALDSGMMAAKRARGLRLCLPRLERLCRPQSERFWVVGGRPGSYKTQFAWNVALNAAAMRQRVLFASLEMSLGELALQGVSRYSGVEHERIRASLRDHDGLPLPDADKARMEAGVLELSARELFLRLHGAEEHGRTLKDVLRSITRVRFDLVVVDHLRMVGGGRLDDVAEAIEALRGLSRGEVTSGYRPLVCVLSPLNREIDRNADGDERRAPRMSDFWGSSLIEHHADVAIVLQKDQAVKESHGPDRVEAFVLKNRQGPAPAVVQLEADGARCLVVERRPGAGEN